MRQKCSAPGTDLCYELRLALLTVTQRNCLTALSDSSRAWERIKNSTPPGQESSGLFVRHLAMGFQLFYVMVHTVVVDGARRQAVS